MRNIYARILIGLAIVSSVVIFSVMLFEPGIGGYIPAAEIDTRAPDLVGQAIESQSEPYCVALAVYFEGGSTYESEQGQHQIARVVVERGRANLRKWGGTNLCDVVFYKRGSVCQFSFACLPIARRTPHGGAEWRRALEIAKQEIEGGSDTEQDSIRYYMNPAITSDRIACRFRKEFVPVMEAGRHEFFREPTREERAALAGTDPIECQRYQAALEAKKRAAKLAAERKKHRLAAIARKRAKKVRVADR